MVLITNYGIELAKFIKKAFLPGFNIIVEKNVFAVIGGFDQKVVHAEDIHFAEKARKKGINLRFIREANLTVSLRRFRREGRMEVLRKYTKSITHNLFKGPITKEIFDYQMGGGYHGNGKRRTSLQQIVEKLQKLTKEL
ncbi:MAG: hypothetical protein M1450_03245 [Patescibacteria group bacterium]|nr:hypothetical protein [Patescibacteria group bacterium]